MDGQLIIQLLNAFSRKISNHFTVTNISIDDNDIMISTSNRSFCITLKTDDDYIQNHQMHTDQPIDKYKICMLYHNCWTNVETSLSD